MTSQHRYDWRYDWTFLPRLKPRLKWRLMEFLKDDINRVRVASLDIYVHFLRDPTWERKHLDQTYFIFNLLSCSHSFSLDKIIRPELRITSESIPLILHSAQSSYPWSTYLILIPIARSGIDELNWTPDALNWIELKIARSGIYRLPEVESIWQRRRVELKLKPILQEIRQQDGTYQEGWRPNHSFEADV